jgi:multimeric flavodoxin WrbA
VIHAVSKYIRNIKRPTMENSVKTFEQFSEPIDQRFLRLKGAIDFMAGKNVVFITTSTRWKGSKETPKSTQLAEKLAEKLGPSTQIINAANLVIFPCEGNVSTSPENGGNHCGTDGSILKDREKNPGQFLRCWASINNKTDELWKISKAIYESDVIVFFGSMRWGSLDSIYKKVLERLTWIENQHTTLGGENPVKDKSVGVMIIGQNWNGIEELEKQKQILKWFGFQTPNELFWNWQFTQNYKDESQESYIEGYESFEMNLEQMDNFL